MARPHLNFPANGLLGVALGAESSLILRGSCFAPTFLKKHFFFQGKEPRQNFTLDKDSILSLRIALRGLPGYVIRLSAHLPAELKWPEGAGTSLGAA